MTALQIRLALLAWKLLYSYLLRQQANLTAEQKAEMKAESEKVFGTRWYEQKEEQ